MAETIFYAWQDDLPKNTNRNFIRTAIDKAIEIVNSELGVIEALRSDQDTQGVPGDINVAEVIFKKIAECRIFVADVTTVSRNDRRAFPNPNVLIEYGRASTGPGSGHIVTVFNEAFGSWEGDRPFDMRHRRKPVLYSLSENHSSEKRSKALDSLVRELADVFVVLLNSSKTETHLPDAQAFDPLRQFYFDTLPYEQKTGRIIGIFCAAIPLSDVVTIDEPWVDESLVQRVHSFVARMGDSELVLQTFQGAISEGRFTHQPIQSGAMGRYDRRFQSFSRERDRFVEVVSAVFVNQNGPVVSVARTTELAPIPMLNIRWILAEVANILSVVNKVRIAANTPTAQYALHVELRYDDQQTIGETLPVVGGEWRLCPSDDEMGRSGKFVTSEPKIFGPFLVDSSTQFSKLMSKLFVQIESSVGRVPSKLISFEDTFSNTIRN